MCDFPVHPVDVVVVIVLLSPLAREQDVLQSCDSAVSGIFIVHCRQRDNRDISLH